MSSAFQMALTGIQVAREAVQVALDTPTGPGHDASKDKGVKRSLALLKAIEQTLNEYQESIQRVYPERFQFMILKIGPEIHELLTRIEAAANAWDKQDAAKKKVNGGAGKPVVHRRGTVKKKRPVGVDRPRKKK